MSFQAKRELLQQVAGRYRDARPGQKSHILDEFVAATGYARKYAIRLLTQRELPPVRPIMRPRAPHYGPAVRDALVVAWQAADGICAKRLVPFLPELVPTLERHGHLHLTAEVRAQLLSVSTATADRLLRPLRQEERGRGISTTKAGPLLKHQVPVRTFLGWDDAQAGFMEADLVAHCGRRAEGSYLYTLVLTDVATGWTECLPLLHRGQEAVVAALGRVRRLLPFPLRGLDTDNGSEFLNTELIAYCGQEEITFTRGRAYKKNDQCYVEQKNGSIVRQVVGYDRFEGERAYRQLTELYRAVRLYTNFFQPSMKLRVKQRTGSHVHRQYDRAQTPLHRLLQTDVLDATARVRLETLYQALDPVRLLQQLHVLQEALWRHAVVLAETDAAATGPTARFDVAACGEASGDTRLAALTESTGRGRRTYHRTKKRQGPRTWRTRPDPLAEVWDEVLSWLTVTPERTGKSVLRQLQERYPDRYPDGQLRTLQRRIVQWRAQIVVEFDDTWLAADGAGTTVPGPLRGAPEPQAVALGVR